MRDQTPRVTEHPAEARPWRGRRGTTVIASVLLLIGAAGATAVTQLTSANANSFALPAGQVLSAGQSITSSNGDYQLTEQSDGDLVENSLFSIAPISFIESGGARVYHDGGNSQQGIFGPPSRTQLWHTATGGHPGAKAVMQNDGNLVVYSGSGAVLWASNTAGHPGAHLEVQDDANTVIYSAANRPLWSDDRVSVIQSGGSSNAAIRDCPNWGPTDNPAIAEDCAGVDYLPNGTGITMLCWLSTGYPIAALPPPAPPSAKWFYVQINRQRSDDYWFIHADLVTNQISTPACQMGTMPAAPTITPGTQPAPNSSPPAPAASFSSPPTTTPASPRSPRTSILTPSVRLAQGPQAPGGGYWYKIALTGFPASADVSVSCHDTVSPGGFRTFTLHTETAGMATSNTSCYSGDGPDHWVVADGTASNHVGWIRNAAPPTTAVPPTTAPPPPSPVTVAETTGGVSHTWTNYSNAGGAEGPSIPANTTVQIACKLLGFKVADGNTWWYRIASAPWSSGFYVSADAFYNNGQTSGSLHGTPWVDNAVPSC